MGHSRTSAGRIIMTEKTLKVLFLSQDATRTGAPIYLLRLLRWLHRNTRVEIHLLSVRGGELLPHFQAVAVSAQVWDDPAATSSPCLTRVQRLFGARLLLGRPHREQVIHRLRALNVDLIYANTTAVTRLLQELIARLAKPFVWHLHETSSMIRTFAGPAFPAIASRARRIIVVSNYNRDEVINLFKVPEGQVALQYPFIDQAEFSADDRSSAGALRAELGIDPDDFLVGACGPLTFVKGPELFILLAREVMQRLPRRKIRFLWLGGDCAGPDYRVLTKSLERLGLSGAVAFVGARSEPFRYFAMFDLFVLCSREDSFPLVVLENAYLGTPTLCFAQSGGISEFVAPDCGVTVGYLDIVGMAAEIIRLAEDHDELARLGRNARDRVRRFSVDAAAPAVYALLKAAVS